MKKVFTKQWFIAAGIRALKTIAQTAVATVGTSVAFDNIDWKLVLSTSCLAGILSLLTSIAGLPELNISDITNTSDITIPENVTTNEIIEDDETAIEKEDVDNE